MRQFAVCKNPGRQATVLPYVVVLQSDVLLDLTTRVVAPLRRTEGSGLRDSRFTPYLEVRGEKLVLLIADMASIPIRLLEQVDSVESQRAQIIAALDLLFTGV